MASVQEPRNGIHNSWTQGEQGIKQQMDENLVKLGALVGLSVVAIGTTATPGSPVNGQAWIMGTPATGDWIGRQANDIAVYNTALPAPHWFYHRPSDFRSRLTAFDESTNRLHIWDGTNWDRFIQFS